MSCMDPGAWTFLLLFVGDWMNLSGLLPPSKAHCQLYMWDPNPWAPSDCVRCAGELHLGALQEKWKPAHHLCRRHPPTMGHYCLSSGLWHGCWSGQVWQHLCGESAWVGVCWGMLWCPLWRDTRTQIIPVWCEWFLPIAFLLLHPAVGLRGLRGPGINASWWDPETPASIRLVSCRTATRLILL